MKKYVLLIILILAASCSKVQLPEQDTGKPEIVTTLFPYYEFAKEIGKERINVYQILPEGADPHSWEPNPSSMVRLYGSDLFIFNGAELEPWAKSVLEEYEGNVIDASSLAELHEHGGHEEETEVHEEVHGFDPHIWLDFHTDLKIIDRITHELSEISPENKDYFLENAQAYKNKLTGLEEKYRSELADCRHKEFIVAGHSAFGYMADEYGLEQVALSGISTNSEPSPKKIAEVINLLKEKQIKYIIYERLSNPKIAEVLAEETGGNALVMDPAPTGGKGSFINIMEDNLEMLKTALECS
ncbi:zinc ABC transporter substrate-binding protein [Candidatus Woesearchaeota archaeon]|nr:zinc ABC transporter substrate-binding protein [Candidatus Woesearchaeota archaeon]